MTYMKTFSLMIRFYDKRTYNDKYLNKHKMRTLRTFEAHRHPISSYPKSVTTRAESKQEAAHKLATRFFQEDLKENHKGQKNKKSLHFQVKEKKNKKEDEKEDEVTVFHASLSHTPKMRKDIIESLTVEKSDRRPQRQSRQSRQSKQKGGGGGMTGSLVNFGSDALDERRNKRLDQIVQKRLENSTDILGHVPSEHSRISRSLSSLSRVKTRTQPNALDTLLDSHSYSSRKPRPLSMRPKTHEKKEGVKGEESEEEEIAMDFPRKLPSRGTPLVPTISTSSSWGTRVAPGQLRPSRTDKGDKNRSLIPMSVDDGILGLANRKSSLAEQFSRVNYYPERLNKPLNPSKNATENATKNATKNASNTGIVFQRTRPSIKEEMKKTKEENMNGSPAPLKPTPPPGPPPSSSSSAFSSRPHSSTSFKPTPPPGRPPSSASSSTSSRPLSSKSIFVPSPRAPRIINKKSD